MIKIWVASMNFVETFFLYIFRLYYFYGSTA